MAVAVAAGFTACSDDNDYEPGVQSPGAYFAKTNPTAVQVNLTTTEFNVVVRRTSLDVNNFYGITFTDPSGLFSAPKGVTFAEDALEAVFPVSYDPTKVEKDKVYKLSFKLDRFTAYGNQEFTMTFKRVQPLVTVPCPPEGQCTFYYNIVDTYDVPGLKITKTYNPEDPDHGIVFTMKNFGYDFFADNYDGVDLNIEMADANAIDQYGTIEVTVPGFSTQQVMSGGEPLWVADVRWFLRNVMQWSEAKVTQYEESYYDPEAGQFVLNLIYYNPESAGSYWWGLGSARDIVQLDGFPDYSVSLDFNGFNLTPDYDASALFTVNSGADVAELKLLCLEGADEMTVINSILAGSGDIMDVKPGEETTVAYPLSGKGTYTAVVISYDSKLEPQLYASTAFEFELGNSNDLADWNDAGLAEYTDGWVLPGFSSGGVGVIAAQHKMAVQLYKNKTNPNLFMLERPYGPGYFLESINQTPTKKCNIQFRIVSNSAIMEEQQTGFSFKDKAYSIGTLEGYFRASADFADLSDEQLVELLQRAYQKPENLTEYADGVVTVNLPIFGYLGEFGYNWKEPQIGYIVMDEDEAGLTAKLAKTRAAALAAPKVKGARAMIENTHRDRLQLALTRQLSHANAKPAKNGARKAFGK